MAFYFDTSAIVKLVSAEAESAALRAWMNRQKSPFITSDLARTELHRALQRTRTDAGTRNDLNAVAEDVLNHFVILTMPTQVFDQAAHVQPPEVRSLDALHLASALSLQTELEAMVVYDNRLAQAASIYEIEVIAPAPQ